jgi:TonB family protein
MAELKSRPMVGRPEGRSGAQDPQPRRLLLALILLVVALAGVVVKDRQFWFGSDQSTLEWDGPASAAATQTAARPVPAAAKPAQPIPVHSVKKQTPAAATSPAPEPSDAPVVATTRTVLPPLDVEVVAGDKHSRIHPGSNTTKVELTHPESTASASLAPATNAVEREAISTQTPQASYPLLAQHMHVQGSVVLQAVVGADGIIQNLHVVSGPAILASAAQQAVREWHFKPVVENGQRVETKAVITVNFNIKIADNSGETIAETRTEDIQILSR